jgi:hypothetical protein
MDFQGRAANYLNSFPAITGAIQGANRIFESNYYSSEKSIKWQNLQRGRIYTFDYDLPSQELDPGGFVDRRPIIIVIPPPSGYPRFSLFGLDLNLFPPINRAKFLSNYSDALGIVFNESGALEGSNTADVLSKINLQSASMLSPGYPVSRIIKGFNVKYIQGFSEINFGDWYLLPYINDFKIQGSTINRIYNS